MYNIIGSDGKQYGPVSIEQLRQWVSEGRINGQTQVQPVGAIGWQLLSTMTEFAAISGTPTAPPVSPPPQAGAIGSVPSYLVQSILVTLCCCLPLGIPAIVFAAQVNGKLKAGDIAGAEEASRKAKMWCWIAFGLGIVANIIVAAIQFIVISQQHGRF